MMRIMVAVPSTPRTTRGTQIWASRSATLPQVQVSWVLILCVSLKPGPKAECLVLCKAFVQYQGDPNVFRVHFGFVEVPPIIDVAAASPSRYLFLLFVDVVDGSVVFGVIAWLFLVTPHWDAVACYSDVGDCGEWVRDGCICDMCVDRYVYMIF